jgi:subtilisin family serine protease
MPAPSSLGVRSSAAVSDDELPAWSLAASAELSTSPAWPSPLTRDWAFGGSDGAGVRVCIVDSGLDATHPDVGTVTSAVAVEDGEIVPDALGDVSGHGTACAGIIRAIAPAAELSSVRVLGSDMTGGGPAFVAGLRWAVEQGFDVVNLSLSTRKRAFLADLHDVVDAAYFARTLLVASAHNLSVESWPWRFASVVSVATHGGDDPLEYHYNARPPVEFFGRGVDVRCAWLDGRRVVATGNSFATAHVAGIVARVRAKHPELTPFALKTVLQLTAGRGDP